MRFYIAKENKKGKEVNMGNNLSSADGAITVGMLKSYLSKFKDNAPVLLQPEYPKFTRRQEYEVLGLASEIDVSIEDGTYIDSDEESKDYGDPYETAILLERD